MVVNIAQGGRDDRLSRAWDHHKQGAEGAGGGEGEDTPQPVWHSSHVTAPCSFPAQLETILVSHINQPPKMNWFILHSYFLPTLLVVVCLLRKYSTVVNAAIVQARVARFDEERRCDRAVRRLVLPRTCHLTSADRDVSIC